MKKMSSTLFALFLLLSAFESCSEETDTIPEYFTPTISSVAHRGYQIHGAVENTVNAYRYARAAGFQFGETDVQWTKDDIPVCCHDEYFFDQTTKDSISIKQYTLEELRQFNYKGTTISTLEEVMDTCKRYGLGLYLDRFTSFNSPRKEKIYDLITRFGKENVCYLFVGIKELGVEQVLEYDSCATIGILYFRTMDQKLIDFANTISSPHNKIILDLDHSKNPTDTLEKYRPMLKDNVYYGFFTVNNKNTYRKYLPYAVSITSDNISEKMLWTDKH